MGFLDDVFDTLFGDDDAEKDANKATQKRLEEAQHLYAIMVSRLGASEWDRGFRAIQDIYQTTNPAAIEAGYQRATQQLGVAQRAAMLGVQERGLQAKGAAEQDTLNRGLYGSTVLENRRDAVDRAQTRDAAQVQGQFGSAYASLETAKADALTQNYSELGKLLFGREQLLQNAYMGEANLLAGVQQYVKSNEGIYKDLVAAADAVIPG